MTCRVYVGEYQDRITGAAATAYVVIDENGRLVKAMAQKVKTNKGLSLQAVKLACPKPYRPVPWGDTVKSGG